MGNCNVSKEERLEDYRNELASTQNKLKKLAAASENLKQDLLDRAQIERSGCKVVNVSSSTWEAFKKHLKQAQGNDV